MFVSNEEKNEMKREYAHTTNIENNEMKETKSVSLVILVICADEIISSKTHTHT